MLDNTVVEVLYAGNASAVTPYPVVADYVDGDTIHASKCAPGSGTVVVVAGVATFSTAQATLLAGSKLRIGTLPGALNTLYEVAERTSSTVFVLRTLDSISSAQFFLVDDATILVQDVDFTLTGGGVVTAVAVPITSIVLIWRETPLTNGLLLPAVGPMLPLEINAAVNAITRQIQELSNRISQTGLGAPAPGATGLLRDTTTFADAAARALAVPVRVGQIGVQLDDNTFWRGDAIAAGQWSQSLDSGNRRFANQTALDLATPAYVGELVVKLDDDTLWLGTGVTPADWIQVVAAGGDVVGPASAPNNQIPLFSGTSGKLIKAAMGTNDGASAFIVLGLVTDTTARPLTVFQEWNNAGLSGRILTLLADVAATGADSTFLNLQDDATGNRGKWMYSGEIRTLEGTVTYPVYSFESEPGTGMYRYTANTSIRFAVFGADVMEIAFAQVKTFQPFTVNTGGTDRLIVTSTFVKFSVPLLPVNDAATDIGTALLQIRDIYFSGAIIGSGTIGTAGATAYLGATLTLSGALTAVGITSASNFTASGDYIFSSRTRIKSGSDGLLSFRNNADSADASVSFGLRATSAAAPTIASTGTIAPTKPITFISGNAAISTITPPSPISTGGGQITLIPTGTFTTDTGGNIALATTAVVGKALIMTFDVTTTKWYPAY